ncbi:glycosyl hydrolase family 95 catalytic domain-containing protein [Draconibacterium sediminis]|nr:hypothetical protein [Draconibacterium sediminis]
MRFKQMTIKQHLVLLLILIGIFNTSCQKKSGAELKSAVDWSDFLLRNDLVWEKMPVKWTEGAFVGNGILGTIFWKEANSLFFEISRTDAYDHRNGTSIYTSRYRMPNGNFSLGLESIEGGQGTMRLNLWNAEVSGQFSNETKKIDFKVLAHAIDEVLLFEVNVPEGETMNFSWHPDTIQTSRFSERGKKETAPYPAQHIEEMKGVNVSLADMPEDEMYNTHGRGVGQFATAWKIVEKGNGKYLVYVTEQYSYPGTTAKKIAVELVERAVQEEINSFVASHRDWWHQYYQKSFLSIPNSRLESFYWIQMYKMASATREDRPIIDLAGPWYMRDTKWPGIWWNLNTQLTYSPFFVANHATEGSSLINWMWKYRENLEANAGGNGRYAIGRSCPITLERPCPTKDYEVGDLGYALYNVWEQYRLTMDEDLLRDKLYPLIKGHYLFYMDHYVEKRKDNNYHLKPSGSPEYTRDGYPAPADCNYNLAIFKWMLRAMIEADQRLHLKDPEVEQVKNVLANLVPYPMDEAEGFMVGENQKFAYSHRHWSHLFMIYPFYEYTYDDPEQGAIIDQSLSHWLSYSEAYRGYSWLAAASMKAMKGEGNAARDFVLKSLDHERFPAQPNTLYIEGAPVIETPLYGARAIQDMILSSYNNTIRIFPAVPDNWKDAAFENLRADGAFLVSAKRAGGKTQFVKIESLAEEPCIVKADFNGEINAAGSREFKLTPLGDNKIQIDLKKGESVILYAGDKLDFTISKVDILDTANYWGVKK